MARAAARDRVRMVDSLLGHNRSRGGTTLWTVRTGRWLQHRLNSGGGAHLKVLRPAH